MDVVASCHGSAFLVIKSQHQTRQNINYRITPASITVTTNAKENWTFRPISGAGPDSMSLFSPPHRRS